MKDSETDCPLCGLENACGMASGAESCWCFQKQIPAEVLASIPEKAIGRSCICQACASKAPQSRHEFLEQPDAVAQK